MQNYTPIEKVVSVEVREQFRGFTGTYNSFNIHRIMCTVGSYLSEIMITSENWEESK